VWEFGRAIALWGFNAVQQFRADSDIDLCRKVLIAALVLMACSMQIALPNRPTFQLPAKRGLVQIAKSLQLVPHRSPRDQSQGKELWDRVGHGDE
jgi:hypothetical protein